MRECLLRRVCISHRISLYVLRTANTYRNKMKSFIEIKLCEAVIWFLERGYGKCLRHHGACFSCRANVAIDFLKEHIKLIKI